MTEEEIGQMVAEEIEAVRLEKAIEKHIPTSAKALLEMKDREFFRVRIIQGRPWLSGWPAMGAVGVLELVKNSRHLLYFFWFKEGMFKICPDEFERL